MKFIGRLVANAVATYLVLYLVDSLAQGRFLVGGIWVAVFAALVLGFFNSLIKPLHRVRTKTVRALIVAFLTLMMNTLVLQIFVWATPLYVANPAWTLLAAAFVSLVTGAIDWLIGFGPPAKARPGVSSTRRDAGLGGKTHPRRESDPRRGGRPLPRRDRPA